MMGKLLEFTSGTGGVCQKFYTAVSVPAKTFEKEAENLLSEFLPLAEGSERLFLKFHLSDPANQANLLNQILGEHGLSAAVVGQQPLDRPGSRIAMEACFRKALRNYRFMFSRSDSWDGVSSAAQTASEFENLSRLVGSYGGTIPRNVIRTWLYCRDIDNNYAGLVSSRRDFFTKIGLTEKTHYIASTGIEGLADPPNRLVRMDSLVLFGHSPDQIEYMHAPEHLSPTALYRVTFERGTRILFGDRSMYLISGTASIDRFGEIVHPGDIAGQTARMAENVNALLEHHGGTLADLKLAVVYLRDPADSAAVSGILDRLLPEQCPRILVRGSVCRPGWLVEMEGVAVNSNGNSKFKKFE